MWSDNETDIDLLDFNHFVNSVNAIIKNGTLLPTTIGIFGDWGSGKSSLIRMVKKELDEDGEILTITFNGWLFEGYEDAKVALMGTILDEIKGSRELTGKAKDIFQGLIKRVNWFRVASMVGKSSIAFALGGPAGLGLSAGADISELIKDKVEDIDPKQLEQLYKDPPKGEDLRKNIRDFHKDFEELLQETKIKTLVVFIDDLDRCTPDTIIETLEAIRLFLFAPQTAFVLGADERLVQYAVRRRFPELPGEYAEVGRDYLEKLIQFPVRIPPLGHSELETYIGLLFGYLYLEDESFELIRKRALERDEERLYQVTFNYGVAQELLGDEIPKGLLEGLVLSEKLAPVLNTGLSGNPRQCKRFLNTLLMRINMAKSKHISLDLKIIAKLMLLEYFRPQYFKRLAELQSLENGQPDELRVMESMVRPQNQVDGSLENKTEKEDQGSSPDDKSKGEMKKSLDPEYNTWLSDPWMKEWLVMEPFLESIDLRPYFFFSRDTLGPLTGGIKRMSPQAQEAILQLLGESDTFRQRTLDNGSSFSSVDAVAVFDGLTERVNHEGDLGKENSPLIRLIDWVSVRKELIPQLIVFLMRIPEAKVPSRIVIRLIEMVQGTDNLQSTQKLLQQWAKSESNKPLAKVAEGREQRLFE